MSEQLDEGLKFVIDTMRESKEFVSAQAPDVIQQMISYDSTMAWIGITFGIVLLITGIVGLIKSKNKEQPSPFYGDDDRGWWMFVMASIMCIAFVIMAINTSTLIKIKTAPKVYILDEFTKRLNQQTK